jgi:hypothetical protein
VVELLRVIADSTGCSRLNGRVSHDPTKGRKGIPSYTTAKVESLLILKDRVRTLELELKAAQREQVDATYIKEKVLKLTSQPNSPPWMAGREI